MFQWWPWVRKSRATWAAERWLRRSHQSIVRMGVLQQELKDLTTRIEEELLNTSRLAKSYDEAMEGLRAENRILGETTVPTLVAQHQLLLQRYEAEIAVQVRRQVSNRVGDER